jgi:hypothetical protein
VEGTVDLRRPCSLEEVKQYGITHWLDEVFEAPALVKEAVRRNAGAHSVVRWCIFCLTTT